MLFWNTFCSVVSNLVGWHLIVVIDCDLLIVNVYRWFHMETMYYLCAFLITYVLLVYLKLFALHWLDLAIISAVSSWGISNNNNNNIVYWSGFFSECASTNESMQEAQEWVSKLIGQLQMNTHTRLDMYTGRYVITVYILFYK